MIQRQIVFHEKLTSNRDASVSLEYHRTKISYFLKIQKKKNYQTSGTFAKQSYLADSVE